MNTALIRMMRQLLDDASQIKTLQHINHPDIEQWICETIIPTPDWHACIGDNESGTEDEM